MKKPKIEVPPAASKSANMFLWRGVWAAVYRSNGKPKWHPLGTPDRSRAEELRDRFFASLRAKGATEWKDSRVRSLKERAKKNPDQFIRLTREYFVVIDGRVFGKSPTREGAVKLLGEVVRKNAHVEPAATGANADTHINHKTT